MVTVFKKYGFKNTAIVIIRWASALSLVCMTSATVLAQSESDSSNLERPVISQTQKYSYRDRRSFRMDIPVRWISEDLDRPTELAIYSSNEGGSHRVHVSRYLSPNEAAVDRVIERNKQYLQEEKGQGNFVLEDGTLGSGDKYTLLKSNGPDQEDENTTLYRYTYHLKKGPSIYVVAFTTSNESMSDTFAQMVNSIQVRRG